jgi:hypothetical protein
MTPWAWAPLSVLEGSVSDDDVGPDGSLGGVIVGGQARDVKEG